MDAAWNRILIIVVFSIVACRIKAFRICFLARHSFACKLFALVHVHIAIYVNVLLERSLLGRISRSNAAGYRAEVSWICLLILKQEIALLILILQHLNDIIRLVHKNLVYAQAAT